MKGIKLTQLKKRLKSNKIIFNFYYGMLETMFFLHPIIPMSFPIKLYYHISMGKKLNLKKPKGFNEKIQWIKVYYRDQRYTLCADKYEVRKYIKKTGYENILNTLYGIYNSVEEIPFDRLPEEYVIKGTKSKIYIHNKQAKENVDTIKQIINSWGNQKYGLATGEFHYLKIKPRYIVEKYIGDKNGTLPIDYKIYCFNGEPRILCIYADRDIEAGTTKRCYFDFNWNPINITTERFYTPAERFERPQNLKLMYKIAKDLSKPFPFVRVDLYEVQGKVIFGELTFTPTGGLGKAYSETGNKIMGDWLTLPEKTHWTKRLHKWC